MAALLIASLKALLLTSGLVAGVPHCSAETYPSESAELGRLVEQYDSSRSSSNQHPAHELGFGHYYQGDIMLPTVHDQEDRLSLSEEQTSTIWPDAIVPYEFSPGAFTPAEIRKIEDGMNEYHAQTCVRFVPRTPQSQYYVMITNRQAGCYATLGRMQESQNLLNLQTPACLTLGTPVHEMMHVLGFLHEVSRPDRDEYIYVNRSALRPEYQTDKFFANNFGKFEENVETYNISYHYGSVMHYSRYAGAVDMRHPVLVNLKPYDRPNFGNDTLSPSDVQAVNFRYCRNATGFDLFKFMFDSTQNPVVRIISSSRDQWTAG